MQFSLASHHRAVNHAAVPPRLRYRTPDRRLPTSPPTLFDTNAPPPAPPQDCSALPAMDRTTTPVHIAARQGDAAKVEQLLAAGEAPDTLSLIGATPLHIAAMCGHEAVVARLLRAAPAAALIQDDFGATPLLHAISHRHAAAARRLLAAAPAAACIVGQGRSPLQYLSSWAESADELELARLLLESAPELATAAPQRGEPPIRIAAGFGRLGMLRLLLEAAPAGAARAGSQLVFCDAALAYDPDRAATIVRLLLAHVPEGAAAPLDNGYTALHSACLAGNAEAASLLAHSAPATAQARINIPGKDLPLSLTLSQAAEALDGAGNVRPVEHYMDCVRVVLPFTPPDLALPDLTHWAKSPFYTAFRMLLSDYVAHWPLSADHWAQVPAPCPGLAHALPAVLARSDAEAALLVSHLPDPDRARLRMAALCLHRSQLSLQVQLPPVLVRHVLSLGPA